MKRNKNKVRVIPFQENLSINGIERKCVELLENNKNVFNQVKHDDQLKKVLEKDVKSEKDILSLWKVKVDMESSLNHLNYSSIATTYLSITFAFITLIISNLIFNYLSFDTLKEIFSLDSDVLIMVLIVSIAFTFIALLFIFLARIIQREHRESAIKEDFCNYLEKIIEEKK